MKNLIILLIALSTLTVSAQEIISFRTYKAHYRILPNEWTEPELANILITIKDNSVINIYSKADQKFYVKIKREKFKTDEGWTVYPYTTIDNEGYECDIFITKREGEYSGTYSITLMYSDLYFIYYAEIL